MNTKITTSEELYTLKEAKAIIEIENKEKRELLLYKVKQKFLGLLSIVIAIIVPFLNDGDATISIFMLPLGLYMIFTRKNVIY